MPCYLRDKSFEQPKNTTVEGYGFFVQNQLSIHNLCKTDNSVMEAFSKKAFSVTVTFLTALTKLSTSPETIYKRLNEILKRLEKRKTTLTNQL